mmetsp:Transcript_6030/g.12633  ORF Transcript_6030/g.12633 Transcript_6030/m.12633 type:complete len:221 (+) Transcript_6030:900-1562(+)
MTDELVGLRHESEVGVELPHGHGREVTSLDRFRFGDIVLVDVEQEGAEAALLKHSHERRPQALIRGGGDLQNLSALVDVGSVNALELQVTRYLRVQQHLRKVPTRHDELGNEVDVVLSASPEIVRRGARFELRVQIREVEGGTFGAVVTVTVHVEDALPQDTQETGDDALLQAGAQDNGIVFAVGKLLHSLRKPIGARLGIFFRGVAHLCFLRCEVGLVL